MMTGPTLTNLRWPVAAVVLLAGVAHGARKPVELIRATTAPPEHRLIDVGVLPFVEATDFIREVRRAEARYVAVRLRRTLEESGHWGAVRVVPRSTGNELTIHGEVLASDGRRLELRIRAEDATGKVWLEKKYRGNADASAYLGREIDHDPFQGLHNKIANDLYKKLKKLDERRIATLRSVTSLRYAADLAPNPFSDYLSHDRKGRYEVQRLPAHEDPLMARVEQLRARDRMFVERIDVYFGELFTRMEEPYIGWQSEDYWRREAMDRGPPSAAGSNGGNAPLGVLIPPDGDHEPPGGDWTRGRGPIPGHPVPPVATPPFVGRSNPEDMETLRKEEFQQSHLEVLQELGESLAADIAPHLVEIEGKVVELTGSATAQYETWRDLLRQLFAEETGARLDPPPRPASP